MGDYKTVVVGTDCSETSYRAVERAAVLARDDGARLIVVSAFSTFPERMAMAAGAVTDVSAFMPSADDISLAEAQARAERAGATDVETMVLEGRPMDVLLQVVEARDADLLVIGNKGLATRTGRLLGSVPQHVLRHCPVDVLVVHTT